MTQSLTKVYALINEEQSPVPAITPQNTVLEAIRAASGPGYNTQATLRGLADQGYSGQVTVSYRRLDLGLLYGGYETVLAENLTTPQDLLDRLNGVRAAGIELGDLEAFTIPVVAPGGNESLVLTALADSYGFVGSVTLTLQSAVVPPVVDVEDATIETPPSAFLFRDTYDTGSGPLTGRVPEAGTYVFDYYGEPANLAPVVDTGELKVGAGMEHLALDGTFTPVANTGGVVSLKVVMRNTNPTSAIPETAYFDIGLSMEDGNYADVIVGTGNGAATLYNSSSEVTAMVPLAVPTDPNQLLEVELRWDTATGRVGVYADSVLVQSIEGSGALAGAINAFFIYIGDASGVALDRVEVKTGVAAPALLETATPPLLNLYAQGGVDANGYWYKTQRATSFTNNTGYLVNKFGGKVTAPSEAQVTWLSQWTPDPTNTSGVAPGFLPNRGPSPDPVDNEILTDTVYNNPLAALVDSAPMLGVSVGVMRVWAVIDGVPAGNYFSVGFGYPKQYGGFTATPNSEGQLTSAYMEIGYAPAPAVVAPTVLIRDDFDGANGMEITTGRIPNISLDAHPYSNLSDGSNARFLLDGAGSIYTSVGPQSAAYGFLAFDDGTGLLRFEMSMRNADGVSALARNFDAMFTVKLRSDVGGTVRQMTYAIQAADELYMYSPDGGEAYTPYTEPLGAGGAAVKFTFEWGAGHAKFFIDDVLQSELAISAAGESQGPGTLYIEFEPGNKIDYIELARVTS